MPAQDAQRQPLSARRRLTRWSVVAALLTVLVGIAWLARHPDVLIQLDFARQRWMAGLSTSTVQVDDHSWTYAHSEADAPDAPLVVLVHGFTGSKENWVPLARALDGAYDLVIPDLAGWGDSQRITGADYGYPVQMARLARFIETVEQRNGRKVVLVGHSMGGGIAALLAARRPDLVARAGLLDASGVRFGDNAFGRDVLAGRNPFEVRDTATLQRYLDILFLGDEGRPWIPWPANRIYIARRVRDAAFEQRVLDGIGRSDARFLPGDEAERITQPTLLLWCRQDAVIDASALGLYGARIPQATRVLLDGCGHMSLMEQPESVAGAIEMLIERGTP